MGEIPDDQTCFAEMFGSLSARVKFGSRSSCVMETSGWRANDQGRAVNSTSRKHAIRDALIAFMAAIAQAQAEAAKEAQRAGIAHAKANGHERAYKGRKPSYSRKQY